jgi:spore coat polysaccharide biosynthesis predicted glycosyltransferase SpsG
LKNNPNILICPLEWGLGHAARMIPLAVKLRDMNYNVFIGAGHEHLSLFRTEIPGLNYIDFPGFKPGYSKYLPQYLSLLLKAPVLIYHIISEHSRLKKIINENEIDIVISDNRFGLWNKKIKTAYITHQPRIPFPAALRIFEFIGILLHRAVMKKYSYCFIPDLPGDLNVSGRLSHNVRLPANTTFIGILSRFSEIVSISEAVPVSPEYDTVILSGPEPQRDILRQKLTSILKNRASKTVIFGGRPEEVSSAVQSESIIYYNHLHSSGMKELITRSENIITRSGYTTIMELISLNRSAMLIPTPGQTEQEYLARYLYEKGWFSFMLQKDLKEKLPAIIRKKIPAEEIISCSKLLLEEALRKLSEDE